MRSLISFFGGIKNTIATIAQILLFVILFPFVAFVAKLIFPEAALAATLEIFQSIPIFGYFFQFFTELAAAQSSTISLVPYLNLLFRVVTEQVYSALLIGMCIYALKLIGNKLNILGVPILQVVVGTIIGVILSTYVGLYDTPSMQVMMLLSMLLIANIVLTLVLEKGQYIQKITGIIIGTSLSAITAGSALSYICVLTMLAVGAMPDLKTFLILLATTGIPCLILVALDFYLMTPKKLK